jgi:hypothetical protein
VNGAERIAAERQRQITDERWSARHDGTHTKGQLAMAAAVYAMPPAVRGDGLALWPWDPWWYKPTPNDRIRELEKAGGLIAAEIDRLLAEQDR